MPPPTVISKDQEIEDLKALVSKLRKELNNALDEIVRLNDSRKTRP